MIKKSTVETKNMSRLTISRFKRNSLNSTLVRVLQIQHLLSNIIKTYCFQKLIPHANYIMTTTAFSISQELQNCKQSYYYDFVIQQETTNTTINS